MGGFAETLAAVPDKYRQYYLSYRRIKDLIVELASNRTPARSRLYSADLMDVDSRPIGLFQEMLQAELKKVNQFACMKHEDVFLGLRRLCDECKTLSRNDDATGAIEKMSARIEELGEEVVHLDCYVRYNYMGFQKLTQKFDKCLGVSGSALFVAGLHEEPFCNIRFDDVLILLGLAWSRWRAAQSAEQSKDATWKPPDSFIRSTTKFWVKPDKVVMLKTRIVKHLPYLIFGASTTDQEKLLDPFALLDLDYDGLDVQSAMKAFSGTMEETQLLSSVYFDSTTATSYNERIRREEGARLVRFRWYGENNLEPDKDIFVERKIHHEGWGGASSAKERCIVPQSEIFSLMKGQMDIDGFFARLAAEGMYSEKSRKAMKGICHEVNTMIQGKQMQPIIRTSYYRCAFQLSTSNEVRISLDTQMSLLNEFQENGHPKQPWCHISSDLLSEEDIYRFPFAILEIKLQNVSETPLWLRQTLADIEAVQVHKFSKFQHAMAFLHPDKVPILPHWHQDFREWHEAKNRRGQACKGERSMSQLITSQNSLEDITVPRLKQKPWGEGHALKDMQNLDPKAIFANERTMLHYAEKGLYAGALAVALLHYPGFARIAGGMLAITVGLFYIWVLVEYRGRMLRITGRAMVAKDKRALRLDVAHGPLIVVALISLVIIISLIESLTGSIVKA